MLGSPGANLETRFPTQVVDLGVVPGKARGWGSGVGKEGSQYRGYIVRQVTPVSLVPLGNCGSQCRPTPQSTPP